MFKPTRGVKTGALQFSPQDYSQGRQRFPEAVSEVESILHGGLKGRSGEKLQSGGPGKGSGSVIKSSFVTDCGVVMDALWSGRLVGHRMLLSFLFMLEFPRLPIQIAMIEPRGTAVLCGRHQDL